MGKIHQSVEETYFADRSHTSIRQVLHRLLPDFEVTWAATRTARNTTVEAFFFKPERHMEEMFGLDREVLFVYADYTLLEPRIFQAADDILNELPARGRVDPLVVGLISPARNLEALVLSHQTDNAQTRIVLPFPESECTASTADAFFARNKLRQSLFARDLFDVTQPITSDLYFFGRSQFSVDLRDAVRAGKNVGLFGLRKMGKTSLIYRLRRTLEEAGMGSLVYLDFQDASLYRLRWWEVLAAISATIQRSPRETTSGGGRSQRNEQDAALRALRETIEALPRNKVTVIALDEVEHIAPGLRMEKHWDRDFLDLWKTLRSLQEQNRHVSLLVAGVNASVMETPAYGGHDNPLYSMAQVRYLPAFETSDVRNMVRTLGRHMGLRFDEDVYPYLVERYGGHPALTRMVCSRIHKDTEGVSRPVRISRTALQQGERARERALFAFGDHILSLLKQWYPEEHRALGLLAKGQVGEYEEYAEGTAKAAEHLLAYQLVDGQPPRIRIPLLADALRRSAGSSESRSPGTQVVKETSEPTAGMAGILSVSELRNRLEPTLRKFIKRTLKAHLGPEKWIAPVLKAIPAAERERLQGVDRDEILEKRLFLLNLVTVIDQNWDYFKGLEACPPDKRVTKVQFQVLLEYVNAHREDAHAKPVSDADVASLRIVVSTLAASMQYLLED